MGESFIRCSDFERLKGTLVDSTGKPYKNGRNLAAGSIRAYDSAVCIKRCLNFLPFAVNEGLQDIEKETNSKRAKLLKLMEFGFGKIRTIQFDYADKDLLELHLAVLKQKAAEDDLPIDGLVLTFDEIAYSKTWWRTGHHFKDGLAFKYNDDFFETRLDHIEWTPSRTGEITPVAVFDTVEIDGCEVSRATLHNLSFIEDLELMPGNRILVSKRNMIIPHIEDNLDRGGFDIDVLIPKQCSCCGEPTRYIPRLPAKHCSVTIRTAICGIFAASLHFVSKKAMVLKDCPRQHWNALSGGDGCMILQTFTALTNIRLKSLRWTASVRSPGSGYGKRFRKAGIRPLSVT